MSACHPQERGAALLLTFLLMLALSGVGMAVGLFSHQSLVTGITRLQDLQAWYLAEAGWQRARRELVTGGQAVGWSATDVALGAGTYTVTTTDNGGGTYTVTASGYVPNRTTPAAQRRITESAIPVNNTGTNLSLTATASASSSQGGNTPGKANDGNHGTRWVAGTAGSNGWLAMDFASATSVNRIIIYERDNIDGLTIELSYDASTWTSVPALSVVESPAKTWTATFDSIRARYVRARLTSVPVGQQAGVEELESYAPRLGMGTTTTQW